MRTFKGEKSIGGRLKLKVPLLKLKMQGDYDIDRTNMADVVISVFRRADKLVVNSVFSSSSSSNLFLQLRIQKLGNNEDRKNPVKVKQHAVSVAEMNVFLRSCIAYTALPTLVHINNVHS